MTTRVKIDIVTEGAQGGDKHVVVAIDDFEHELAGNFIDLEDVVKLALEHCDDAHALSHEDLQQLVAKAKDAAAKQGQPTS